MATVKKRHYSIKYLALLSLELVLTIKVLFVLPATLLSIEIKALDGTECFRNALIKYVRAPLTRRRYIKLHAKRGVKISVGARHSPPGQQNMHMLPLRALKT